MIRDETGAGRDETKATVRQQDEATTRLIHSKMLQRLRETSNLAATSGRNSPTTIDDILLAMTEVKKQHRHFLAEVKRARAIQTRNLAREARLLNREPFPHLRPWNDSRLLYPEPERLTPEVIAGDALLEWQEIKRVRKDESAEHPSWKYPNADRAFGDPPLYCCTDSFKRVLAAHLEQAVAKISKDYEAMGEGTLRLSNMKADIGAELWLMQSSLDEVRKGLKKAREEERAKEMRVGYRKKA